MRIGLNAPQYGALTSPDAIVRIARAAEEMGYDSLWTGDRILAPLEQRDRYPGGDGVMPSEYRRFLDPLAVLTFVAAHTTRLRLGTSTLNAPWYPPVLLARSLTTLDVLSGGRVEAGFGIGWMRDEYAAVNVPWAGRGDRLDETLDVLEHIWSAPVVSHDGPLFSIVPTTIEPKPVQRPRPPILLAGLTPRSLDRVARRADGWLAVGLPLPHLTKTWAELKARASRPDLRMVLRLNPHFTDKDSDQAPRTGTLRQVVDYALASGADEVLFDIAQTTSSVEEVVDVAGALVAAMRGGSAA
jgi:probable F420-dependent oxidoreductase